MTYRESKQGMSKERQELIKDTKLKWEMRNEKVVDVRLSSIKLSFSIISKETKVIVKPFPHSKPFQFQCILFTILLLIYIFFREKESWGGKLCNLVPTLPKNNW